VKPLTFFPETQSWRVDYGRFQIHVTKKHQRNKDTMPPEIYYVPSLFLYVEDEKDPVRILDFETTPPAPTANAARDVAFLWLRSQLCAALQEM
jgi:hypothetical protein